MEKWRLSKPEAPQVSSRGGAIDLLRTFSDHSAFPAEANEGLFAGIREVIEPEFGGKIDIDRVVVLYVAGRTDG